MNGAAVLLCLAVLGVDHTWRTSDEGQLEYVLQIEPGFLPALERGEVITSKLPKNAQEVHRLCLRIGAADLKEIAKQAPQIPPLASAQIRASRPEADIPVAVVMDAQGQSAETTDVSHGWQPANKEQVAYTIQLTPQLLGSLREGDELYMNLYPEAGTVHEFKIVAGQKVLPRNAAKPAAAPIAVAAAEDSRSLYGPAIQDEPGEGVAPTTEAPTEEPPRLYQPRWNVTDATASGAGKSEEPAAPPKNKFGHGRGHRAPPTLSPPAAQRKDLDVPRFDNSGFAATDDFTPERGATPEADTAMPGRRATTFENEKRPPTHKATFGKGRVENDVAFTANEEPDDKPVERVASLDKTKPGVSKGATRTKTSAAAAADSDAPKPWWPLVFTCCALFLSIGGNVYLGWTVAEFYNRYKMAVERVRSSRQA